MRNRCLIMPCRAPEYLTDVPLFLKEFIKLLGFSRWVLGKSDLHKMPDGGVLAWVIYVFARARVGLQHASFIAFGALV